MGQGTARAGCAPGERAGAACGRQAGTGQGPCPPGCSPVVPQPEEQSTSGDSSRGQLAVRPAAGRQVPSEEVEAEDAKSVVRVRISISVQQHGSGRRQGERLR